MSINLLTREEKKRIRKIYKVRRLQSTVWFLVILILVSVIMLTPIYLLGESIELMVAEKKNELLKENGQVDPDYVEEAIQNVNKKAKSLQSISEYTKVYKLLSDITENKLSGIGITGISFTSGEEQESISLVGKALNRETLLSFRRDLEQKDYSETVDLPISNFAQNVDIDFSIKITLKRK